MENNVIKRNSEAASCRTGAEPDCQVVTGKGDPGTPFLLSSNTVGARGCCLFWGHRWPKMRVANSCHLSGQSLSLEHLLAEPVGMKGSLGKLLAKLRDWHAGELLCLPNNLFPQQFLSPVFFGLLKFDLLGGKCQVKDISVLKESVLGSLFACSCRDKLDLMAWL